MRKKTTVLTAVVFMVLGCSSVQVNVTGYRNQMVPLLPGQSVFVATNAEAENLLLEKEVGEKISRHLQARGYKIASFEEADLVLLFDYGRSLGKVKSITFRGQTDTIPIKDPYSGTTTYKNIEGPGHTEIYQNYMRSLSMKILDANKLRKGLQEPVWTCDVVSEGRSSDLRYILDFLIRGAFEYFGQDTGKAVQIRFGDS